MRKCKHAGYAVEVDGQMDEALLSQTMEVSSSISHSRVAEFRDKQTRHSSVSVPRLEPGDPSSGLEC